MAFLQHTSDKTTFPGCHLRCSVSSSLKAISAGSDCLLVKGDSEHSSPPCQECLQRLLFIAIYLLLGCVSLVCAVFAACVLCRELSKSLFALSACSEATMCRRIGRTVPTLTSFCHRKCSHVRDLIASLLARAYPEKPVPPSCL